LRAKYALIIGIDEYSNFEEKYQLSGCVNDAKLMKSVLIDHFNFKEAEITELHNAAAGQQGILQAMEQVHERVKKDDIVVFHFSGHGSQRTSVNPDEGTGMNSTITPADSGCVDPFPNLDIIDDVINDWLGRLASKTRYITLTFDCCHSGTITRDAFGASGGAKARNVPADRRSLAAMGVDPNQLTAVSRNKSRATGSGGWLALSDSYVVMSGCRDDEFSYEFESEVGDQLIKNGALTHFLTNALLRARPGSTYRDVFELARQGVNTKFPDQHPQIEGAQDREIYGVEDIEPLRFIPVTSIDGDKVTLGGGAAHGLFQNSLWTAYPQGTKQTKGSTKLGVIEISQVGALTTEGVVREGKDKIVVGARCIETAPAAGQFLLSVDLSSLDGASDSELTKRVGQSKLLTIATKPGTADLSVHVFAPGKQASKGTPVPELAEIKKPTWVVVDRAGALAMPPHAADEEKVIETLVTNFEVVARYRNALRLDNPGSELNVEFNIYAMDSKGELQQANGGDFVFEEGDHLVFEVINHEKTNVFVSVLDFGLTGDIALFYPPKKASEMIAAGQTLKIGTGRRKIRLGIPEELLSNQGTETLKAFITNDEADFRWLQQEGTRSADISRSGLRQQFEAAYDGPATRFAILEGGDDESEDWKGIARSFQLRRRPA
jgi:hypothetical protein